MKKSALVAIIFIGICMAFGFTYHRSKHSLSIQFNVKDLPEDGLILIPPSDLAFDAEAASLIGDTPGSPAQYLDAAKPFCVFIKNIGTKEIAGYRLKWELLRDDGKVITNWSSASVPSLLSKDEQSSRMESVPPLRPNKTLFVSWEPAIADLLYSSKSSQAPQTEDLLHKRNEFMSQLNLLNKERIGSIISVTVSVDGAYFSDGTFIGPDTGNLFAETQGYLDAQRELGLLVRQHIQQKHNPSELFDKIKAIADEPDEVLGSSPTPAEYKTFLLKFEARNLLKIRVKGGERSAIEHTQQPLAKTWAKLQKKMARD